MNELVISNDLKLIPDKKPRKHMVMAKLSTMDECIQNLDAVVAKLVRKTECRDCFRLTLKILL